MRHLITYNFNCDFLFDLNKTLFSILKQRKSVIKTCLLATTKPYLQWNVDEIYVIPTILDHVFLTAALSLSYTVNGNPPSNKVISINYGCHGDKAVIIVM